MVIIGTRPRGSFRLFKNPGDVRAPYQARLRLPDGRRYRGRLRSHPLKDRDGFWYEGFVTAESPLVFAQDQELTRYPAPPSGKPLSHDLWPCKVKINPCRKTGDRAQGSELIGPLWVRRKDAADGGEVLTLFGHHVEDSALVMRGDVLGSK